MKSRKKYYQKNKRKLRVQAKQHYTNRMKRLYAAGLNSRGVPKRQNKFFKIDPTFVTQFEAKKLGFVRFFTGAACKYGHVAERRVKGGACVVCSRDKIQSRNDARRAAGLTRRGTPRIYKISP